MAIEEGSSMKHLNNGLKLFSFVAALFGTHLSFAQDPDVGWAFALVPGIGVATPVSEVGQTGAKWGYTFIGIAAYRERRWEVAVQPTLSYETGGTYRSTYPPENTKIRRAGILGTCAWYLNDKLNWYVKTGIGFGSFMSYSKPAPVTYTAWPQTGTYVSTGLIGLIGFGYNLRLGHHVSAPISLEYYPMHLGSMRYEWVDLKTGNVNTGFLALQIGIGLVKSHQM